MKHIPIILISALLCMSCASTGANAEKRIHIYSISSTMIRIDNNAVPVELVAKKLKRKGYGPRSSIFVHVPEHFTNAELSTISRHLRGAGFRRVMCLKPTQTSVNVSTPTLKK
jgi:hypothetical protein